MTHAAELARGDRFAFGKNWTRFLELIDEDRIREAEASLRLMLECDQLTGRSFLDVGCGSGLFSLAARRLGARVHSFDYDPTSVECARSLRHRFYPTDTKWQIETGSILDPGYISSLGSFDIVYAWGVLHHTGALWQSVEHVTRPLAPGGRLWLAVYNDQGWLSGWWRWVKRGYRVVPAWARRLYVAPFYGYAVAAGAASDLAHGRHPAARYRGRGRRGMSMWHDAVDWVGGWPFEVATPDAVVKFGRSRGLVLRRSRTVGRRQGCNEFVFDRLVGNHP